MRVTRSMARGNPQQLSVHEGGGRQRKESAVVPWLDRNDNPLMNDVVLRTLFEYVKVKDLKSCRLVSKKWNEASLPFVRSNFSVTILGKNITCNSLEMKGVESFVQLISTNTLEIPFARYRLGTFDTTKGAGQEFLQLCGKTATEIIFIDDDVHMIEDIAQLLRSTPKLEYLTLPYLMKSKNRKHKIVKLFPGDIKPKLSFLKSVNVEAEFRCTRAEFIKKCPTFYEELFEVAENISTLDLKSFSDEVGLKILETIAKLGRMKSIKNFKFRHFTTPENFDLLKGLKLERIELAFSLFGRVIVDCDWFELITLSRDTLISLNMNCLAPDHSTFMIFQPMPKVKELKLRIFAKSNSSPSHNNFSHIFPSLEKLNLALPTDSGDQFDLFIGDEDSPCPNMKSLILPENPIKMEDLNRILTIFPSLKVFKCKITTVDGVEVIKGIWTHMTQLEDLSICGMLGSSVNLDSLVTGIPVKEIKTEEMKTFVDSIQEQSIEIRREKLLMETNKRGQLPSIRNLTNLRSLEINLTTQKPRFQRPRVKPLTDLTGYLGFYSLRNLRHLSAHGCEISKDCMEVLAKDVGLHTWTFHSSSKIRGRYQPFTFESN